MLERVLGLCVLALLVLVIGIGAIQIVVASDTGADCFQPCDAFPIDTKNGVFLFGIGAIRCRPYSLP